MTKYIGLQTKNQGTALARGTLAIPPLVIEGLEEFKGSFDRLCLQAGTAAIEAVLVSDAPEHPGAFRRRRRLRGFGCTRPGHHLHERRGEPR